MTPPIVTISLIALNVFVFLFQWTLDPFSANDFIFAFGFIPDHFTLLSILSSLFLHSGWMHLISNMVFLWIFGDNVEDILGHWKFLLFYLLCGVAAAMAQYAVNPDSRIPQIGERRDFWRHGRLSGEIPALAHSHRRLVFHPVQL